MLTEEWTGCANSDRSTIIQSRSIYGRQERRRIKDTCLPPETSDLGLPVQLQRRLQPQRASVPRSSNSDDGLCVDIFPADLPILHRIEAQSISRYPQCLAPLTNPTTRLRPARSPSTSANNMIFRMSLVRVPMVWSGESHLNLVNG